jgi:hypothetical protein
MTALKELVTESISLALANMQSAVASPTITNPAIAHDTIHGNWSWVKLKQRSVASKNNLDISQTYYISRPVWLLN